MRYKYVTLGSFKELVSSGGVQEVIAKKGDNNKYIVFGLANEKGTAYLVKTARGSNQAREWKNLSFLGDFIESAGISGFTVIGLSNGA
jgi:hypothetical protein